MKKVFYLPLLVLAMMLIACDKDGDIDEPNLLLESQTISGELLYNGTVIKSGSECSIDVVDDNVTITLRSAQFAPAMPPMDITIPGLDWVYENGVFVISGKNVVPTAFGSPVEAYTFSTIEARLTTTGRFTLTSQTRMGSIGFTNVDFQGGYKGNLAVGDFSNEKVVDVLRDKNLSTMDIVINDAQFAANMPVAIDITLKGIPYVWNGGISFSATEILPFIGTSEEPVAAYKFASLSGTILDGKLVFTAKMADDLAPYVAGKEFVFDGVEIVE